MSEKIIMTSEYIRRTLRRIAHEIIERNSSSDHLLLIGIHTRGVPLAKRLATHIESLKKFKPPVGALDISLHRDDLSALEVQPVVKQTDIPTSIGNKSIVLVDDVLYTGRSARAAIDAIIDFGRPQSIQLAVLIDRGHREMPLQADYVGKNIPSSRHEEIQVRLVETDGVDEVALINKSDSRLLNKLTSSANRKELT